MAKIPVPGPIGIANLISPFLIQCLCLPINAQGQGVQARVPSPTTIYLKTGTSICYCAWHILARVPRGSLGATRTKQNIRRRHCQ